MKGEVIGVASFQIVEGQNLNFAIPAEKAAKLAPREGQTLREWGASVPEARVASAEGLYSSGLRLLWVGDYTKALQRFEDAVEGNPRYAEAYFQIGYCNDQLGRYAEAIEPIKQAIRIKPDYAEAYVNLGATYHQLTRYTEAAQAYNRAISIKPDYAMAYCNLGMTYGKVGTSQ